ncbi:MAG: DUF3891 family protein [Anaerolineae bacterium]
MLTRDDPDGPILITQPAHAWMAGQMAAAWGNDLFGEVAPRDEVCLAAAQHDIGWVAWEGAPTLNGRTGRPYTFLELPTGDHVRIWSSAVPAVLAQSRYAALLVSLHFSGLYARHNYARDTAEEAQAARALVARQAAFEEQMTEALRREGRYAAAVTPAAIARNRRLVAVWDALSLALGMGLRGERTFERVPTADSETTLTLTPAEGGRIAVAPWPFAAGEVTLTVEGRRLTGTFADDEVMRTALRGAPWVTLEFHLADASAKE